MTEKSIAIYSADFTQKFSYSVQTDYERKNGGGLGRCEHSYWKHDLIEKFMRRQLPVLMKRGKGCIIDMLVMDKRHPIHSRIYLRAGH